jgi:hypothetical protein
MKSPWRITTNAITRYSLITGRPKGTARTELITLALDALSAPRTPTELDNGSIVFKGPRPLRLRMVVLPSPIGSTDPPTLIDVLPDHPARKTPYARSGQARRARRNRTNSAP